MAEKQVRQLTIMEELIKKLASMLPCEKDNKQSFYDFAKSALNRYEQVLSETDEELLKTFLKESDALHCIPSKTRFINLIKKIDTICLSVLSAAYKGDLYTALNLLKGLLVCTTKTDRKLNDILLNYFEFDLKGKEDIIYYRCVDYDKNDATKDCYHLPFNLRHKASNNRFNQLGVICMYLSSSKDIADKEVGQLDEKKERWLGAFKIEQRISLLNMKIPSCDEIEKMTPYDMFSFLVIYPFLLLCLTKDENKQSNTFCDSYLFSQLLFQCLFLDRRNSDYAFYDGIIYSSMEDRNEYNIVIPAKYDTNEPPKEGYSKKLKQLIKAAAPPIRIK